MRESSDMAILTASLGGSTSGHSLSCSQDFASDAKTAFDLVCEVEKWPVWMSFLRSSRRLEPAKRLAAGSEIGLRSTIPGEDEELYEVDHFIDGHLVSLVGAFSVRRRLEFRIERKSAYSRLVVRCDYPTYGGMLGAFVDRMTYRRKLEGELGNSLVHFKGLVEYDTSDGTILDDL